MLSRFLGSTGRTLITSGIVVLMFVGYQLWGTGIQEAQAQNSLDNELDALFEDDTTLATTTTSIFETTTAPSTTQATVESSTTSTTLAADVLDPVIGPDEVADGQAPPSTIAVFDPALSEKLYREGGEAIARLNIPSIGVRKVVVEGVQVEDLRNGPGHYRATVLPGQEGNSGIAGHRTTYGAPFNRIDELVPGDEVNVQTVQGFHEYRVISNVEAFGDAILNGEIDYTIPDGDLGKGHVIVPPQATWVLGDFGDNRITLTACHPKYSAAKRIVVVAELITDSVIAPPPPADYSSADDLSLANENVDEAEATAGGDLEEAPQTEETAPDAEELRSTFVDEVSLDEGLNGEKDALRPAILWGLLATALYIGFKELAGRWRRWPAIAIGILPVAIPLALCFEKVGRYLPAG